MYKNIREADKQMYAAIRVALKQKCQSLRGTKNKNRGVEIEDKGSYQLLLDYDRMAERLLLENRGDQFKREVIKYFKRKIELETSQEKITGLEAKMKKAESRNITTPSRREVARLYRETQF